MVELNLKSPVVGVVGRCAVVPTETFIAVVLFISIVPCPVVVNPILLPALSVVKVVSVTVKLPIPVPPPTPNGPTYLAPTMYTDFPVTPVPITEGMLVPLKFKTPDE